MITKINTQNKSSYATQDPNFEPLDVPKNNQTMELEYERLNTA